MRTAALALLAVSIALPAIAQNRPSFDCTKAATAHERTICGNPELAAADREMAAAYAALAGRLTGTAKTHLEASQKRWVADWRGCDGNPQNLAGCLGGRYRDRTAELKLFASGPYPFISDHAIIVTGKTYYVDAAYPQFDGTFADFGAVNRRFAESTRKDVDFFAGSPDGGFEQDFDLARPMPNLISILLRRSWWTAHVVISIQGTLIDLGTGRPVGLDALFLSRHGLDLAIEAVVRKEFAAEGRGDPPADLASQIAQLEAAAFIFEADALTVTLDGIARAIAMKGYTIDIPYADLKGLIRPDGPLAGKTK